MPKNTLRQRVIFFILPEPLTCVYQLSLELCGLKSRFVFCFISLGLATTQKGDHQKFMPYSSLLSNFFICFLLKRGFKTIILVPQKGTFQLQTLIQASTKGPLTIVLRNHKYWPPLETAVPYCVLKLPTLQVQFKTPSRSPHLKLLHK